MKKKTVPASEKCGISQPQVFFIDGCKVTIAYSEEKNPTAARAIKDTLLNCGVSYSKS